MKRSKDEAAEELIRWHFQVEPGMVRIYRVISDNEDDADEPIKLLELNTATVSTGRFSAFGFAPSKEIPYPTLIAELTPEDLDLLRQRGQIPEGWNLDRAREYRRPAA